MCDRKVPAYFHKMQYFNFYQIRMNCIIKNLIHFLGNINVMKTMNHKKPFQDVLEDVS
uniref:Uncharacterized protein n=1 Tax=Meloidogyne incognita TaxID=6306 RepID=A0A914L3Q7_MELIC